MDEFLHPSPGVDIEYLRDLGTRAFIPLEEMIAAWKKHYGEGILERWNAASKTIQELQNQRA